MSQYEHVLPEFRHVMALSDAERIQFLKEPRWVAYPAGDHASAFLLDLMTTPKRPRMPNLLLVAEPFNGKTTLIRRFHALHGVTRQNERGATVRPVHLVESPPRASEKELYCAVLEHFHAPYRASAQAVVLRHQVIHLCRACEVQLLIFDEFHSLLEGTPRQQREVMNALKLLCNTLMIPVVGVGTRAAVRALHTDPQHASRFDVLELPLWKLDASFQQMLAGFEVALPLKKPSQLYAGESAGWLHLISGGNMGDLHRLLMVCAEEAITSGKECIDLPLIQSKRRWQRPSVGYLDVSVAG